MKERLIKKVKPLKKEKKEKIYINIYLKETKKKSHPLEEKKSRKSSFKAATTKESF